MKATYVFKSTNEIVIEIDFEDNLTDEQKDIFAWDKLQEKIKGGDKNEWYIDEVFEGVK